MTQQGTPTRMSYAPAWIVMVLLMVSPAARPVPAQGVLGGLKEAGGVIAEKGKQAGGVISQGAKDAVQGVGDAVAPLDPVQAARRELNVARTAALARLPKFDPTEVLRRVQRAVRERVVDELKRNDAAYDERTGVMDLRSTRMGKSLDGWLGDFAQGNKSEGEVRELSYNVRTRLLTVRLYARHCQSWGKAVHFLGPIDLYEVRQTADFHYNFRTNSGDFDINLGTGVPRVRSKTLERIAEGDLIAAGESMAPEAIGRALGMERVNRYDEVVGEYRARFGPRGFYFASSRFVQWASPDTLRRYAISGIATGGTTVAQTMRQVQHEAMKEMIGLAGWLQDKGLGQAEARGIATDLLSGRPVRWPFLEFDLVPVRYSAREKNVGTDWRHENHLGFVVVWTGGAEAVNRNDVDNPIDAQDRLQAEAQREAELRAQQEAQELARAEAQQRAQSQAEQRARREAERRAGRDVPMTPPSANREVFAANLGITYTPVRYGDGTFGARLTRPPAPGSPAAQLGMEIGDVVLELDNQRFARAEDVLNHRQQTSVVLIDVRTNQRRNLEVLIPSEDVVAPPVEADQRVERDEPTPPTATQDGELFAANLGIYYERIAYDDGTFGAKLTRDPLDRSPAASLRLEPGDVVIELDGMRFRQPADVLNHRAQTSLKFINVRTNASQSAVVQIP